MEQYEVIEITNAKCNYFADFVVRTNAARIIWFNDLGLSDYWKLSLAMYRKTHRQKCTLSSLRSLTM